MARPVAGRGARLAILLTVLAVPLCAAPMASAGTTECFDSQPFAACSGPGASHTPSTALSSGSHTFYVQATDRAKNADPTPATRSFTVIP